MRIDHLVNGKALAEDSYFATINPLDIGAQTLLVPMIDTAEQAAEVVAATRYPPQRVRGDYLVTSAAELCVLVQVETVTGLDNLADIVNVDGVDGVFLGPSDLSASMGLPGKAGDPKVHDAVLDGIRTVCAAHKAAGVLTSDRSLARAYLDAGPCLWRWAATSAFWVSPPPSCSRPLLALRARRNAITARTAVCLHAAGVHASSRVGI